MRKTHTRETADVLEGDDALDYITAFTIGAALGVGAVLLLRPSRRGPAGRVPRGAGLRRKAPPGGARRLQKRVRRTASPPAGSRARPGRADRSTGRDVRATIRDAVEAAREEIARTVEAEVAEAKKTLERTAKRLRRS